MNTAPLEQTDLVGIEVRAQANKLFISLIKRMPAFSSYIVRYTLKYYIYEFERYNTQVTMLEEPGYVKSAWLPIYLECR